nr:hypothetical protein [uncultured Treponema sp.]
MKKCLIVILSLFFVSCSNNIREIIVNSIADGNYEKVDKLLENNDFTQEEYNSFATLIYKKDKNIEAVIKRIRHGLPADSFCGRESILQLAVSEQRLSDVKELLNSNASPCLLDKSKASTPLSVAICKRGKNSVPIFKLLFENTVLSELDSNVNATEDDVNSIFWYYNLLIENSQNEMLAIFLENPQVIEIIEVNPNTLKLLVNSKRMFCKENVPIIDNENLALDDDYDYFKAAVYSMNIDAIDNIMKRHIEIKDGLDWFDSFLASDFNTNQVQSAEYLSDDFLMLKDLQPKIHRYFNKN